MPPLLRVVTGFSIASLVSSVTANMAVSARSTSTVIQCRVVLLDNTEFITAFDKKAIFGQEILERTCRRVQVAPSCVKYFGLRSADHEDGGLNWLSLAQEIKASNKTKVHYYQFAVKVFPPDPQTLEDRFTRKQLMLQVKELACRGTLALPVEQHARLDAFYAQAMLGNFNPRSHTRGYLDDLLGLFYSPPTGLNVDNSGGLLSCEEYEVKVRDLHKSYKGLCEDAAVIRYLDGCRQLPSYGVFEHRGAGYRDDKTKGLVVAVSFRGLQVYELGSLGELGRQLEQVNWRDVLAMYCNKDVFSVILGSVVAGETERAQSRAMLTLRFRQGHFGHRQAERLLGDADNHQNVFLSSGPNSTDSRRAMSLQSQRKARHQSRSLSFGRTQPLFSSLRKSRT